LVLSPRPLPRGALAQDLGRLGVGLAVMEPCAPSGTSEGGSDPPPAVELEPVARTDAVHEGHGVAIGLWKPADEVAGGERLHSVEPRGGSVERPGVVDGPFL